MGLGSTEHLASPDLSLGALEEYGRDFAESDLAGDLVVRHAQGYYVEEDFTADPTFQRHSGSATYNEWYRKHRLTDAVGLLVRGDPHYVPGLYAHLEAPVVANVLLTGSMRSRGEGAEAARTLLALLHPALAAAVRTWQLVDASATRVAAALDAVNAPLWLFGADGGCLHESAEAGQLAASAPDGEVLRAAADQLARAMLRGRRAGLPVATACRVPVGGAHLRLSGSYLPGWEGGGPAVLVRAEGGAPRMPGGEELRARFGLTPQEARVALLRARGEGTAGVAERLGVSVHTARRHTERAMEKLGVRRASEIGPRLLSL